MKKSVFILFLVIFSSYSLNSQTVDSIKVEQAGDLIKVHYKILNSTDKQTFRVTVTCSLNGGLQSIPKSLSGDFGENVVGGRDEYMVLWDVLKDVDELKSVEFIVKAELTKDYSITDKAGKSPSKKRVHAFLAVGGPGPVFGAKVGYMESWGIAAMYVVGGEMDEVTIDLSQAPSHYAASLNLTKRVINAKNFKIHLFTGVMASRFEIKDAISSISMGYKTFPGIEAGLITSIRNLAISFGVGAFKDERANNIEISGDEMVGNFGIGWRF